MCCLNSFVSRRSHLTFLLDRLTDLLAAGCKAGLYAAAGKCQQCPQGTVSAAGATSCRSCPAGQYEFNRVSCKNCRAGKYSEEKASKCILCGPGKVSQAKAPACTVCQAGQYASHADNLCKPCPRNKFSTGSVDSCSACPRGSYSGPGGKECQVCVPGQYYDAKLLCVDCLPSFYSTNPNMVCTKCPANKYSGPKDTACSFCAKGLRVKADQSGCEPDTTPPPTPAPTFHACDRGSGYDYVLNKCVLCKPGFYHAGPLFPTDPNAGTDQCSPCGRNQYSSTPGAGQCSTCGDVVNADRTACESCKPSFFQLKFLQNTPDIFFSTSDVCVKCPPKTYTTSDSSYLTVCEECPSGSQVNAAQTGCVPGPIIPITDPPVCGPGLEYDVSIKRCVSCKVGYEKEFSFQSCTRCLPGHYAAYIGTLRCAQCSYGGSVGPDRSYCKSCDSSFYAEVSPVGDYPYTNLKDPVCVKCPKGTHTTPYPSYQTKCSTCPAGIVVNDEQTGCGKPTQKPTRNPKACPPGEGSGYGTRACTPCEPGEAPYGPHECWPCRAGTYTPNYRSAVCLTCPITKVVKGRTRCVFCEPSYYRYQPPSYPYPFEVEAICEKCPSDRYSGFEDTGCHECPKGSKVNALQTGCVYSV